MRAAEAQTDIAFAKMPRTGAEFADNSLWGCHYAQLMSHCNINQQTRHVFRGGCLKLALKSLVLIFNIIKYLPTAHDASSLCRAGDAAGVVVGHRMHPIRRPGYGGQVWQRACHRHPQPQLRDRLPVWLDHV